jgi:hypothetical protein
MIAVFLSHFSKGDSVAGQRKIPVFKEIDNEARLWDYPGRGSL